jgi:hypothetical protein
VVAQSLHVSKTPAFDGAYVIWRTHVSREEIQNIPESHLVFDHLIHSLLAGNPRQILVAPRMACNLVALCVHSPKKCWIRRACVVDRSLGAIDGSDEKRRRRVVCAQDIQQI